MRQSLTASARARFDALRAVRELDLCSDKDIWSLLSYADEVCMRAGDQIARQGRNCTEFVAVMEGSLRAESPGSSCLLERGDSCGWDAMWERSPNPATVTVESDARLLIMSHAQFRAVKALAGPEPQRASRSAAIQRMQAAG